MIGETVGSYKIISKLSTGGMGTVYRAEHALIGKAAAVKVLHPELSTNHEVVNRFFNEAKATTTIKHPGIVDVIDFGYMASGHAYLTMEFLEGMSLGTRLEVRGPMSEGEAAILLRYVCSALQAAHAKGIVHRDLKPDNIFMCPDAESSIGERPKILDFGIAKLTDIGLAGSATKTGAVMGTPTYMSPEQCRGTGNVDHRSDLYSIGCIFYELVTGQPPFTELGAGELIGAHLFVEPPSPDTINPELSPSTVALIMALLQKKPDQRPQSVKELGSRLTALAQQHGWITAGSPNGVTGPKLDDLPLRTPVPSAAGSHTPVPRAATPVPARPPSKPAGTTPYHFTPSAQPTPAPPLASQVSMSSRTLMTGEHPVEKPTTLSGAASSIHDIPRRSRKGLGIAIGAGALFVIGIVTVVALGGGEPDAPKPAATPIKESVAPPVAAPIPPPPPPVDIKPPDTTVADTKPVETAPAVKQPVTKPPVKRPPIKRPKTDPKKPDKILIETDI